MAVPWATVAIYCSGYTLNPVSISENYVLLNNYPNPFNSETHIGFILKNNYNVGIDVYDVLGRKIKTIFAGDLSSGYQGFIWDGRTNSGQDASSGTYLIRFNVGGSIKTLKALYLK